MAFSGLALAAAQNDMQNGGPAQGALTANLAAQGQNAQNQLLRAQIPYAGQLAQANALLAQGKAQGQGLANQYYPQKTMADIHLQNAQSGLYGSEAQKNAFLMKNPQYINPEGYIFGQPVNGSGGTPSGYSGQPSQENSLGTGGGTTNPSNGLISSPMNQSSQAMTYGQQKLGQMTAAARQAQMNANLTAYKSLPANTQSQIIAQGAGAGMQPDEVMQEIANGKNIDQIMQERGYQQGNYPALAYANTPQDVESINKRRQAIAQVNVLGDWAANSLGPYSQTIHGYSPQQIADAMKGMNRDQQINFLAARMVSPDLAGFRTQVAGLHAGKGMIQEMIDRSMSQSKIFQGLVQPDIYEEAQKLATQKLTDAGSAANDVLLQAPGSNVKQVIKNDANNFNNQMIQLRSPDNKLYNVPTGKAQKFIENGYKRVS